MWIVKTLYIHDFSIEENSHVIFSIKADAVQYFKKNVSEERAFAEKNGLHVETDTETCYEAYPEGSSMEDYTIITLDEVEVR